MDTLLAVILLTDMLRADKLRADTLNADTLLAVMLLTDMLRADKLNIDALNMDALLADKLAIDALIIDTFVADKFVKVFDVAKKFVATPLILKVSPPSPPKLKVLTLVDVSILVSAVLVPEVKIEAMPPVLPTHAFNVPLAIVVVFKVLVLRISTTAFEVTSRVPVIIVFPVRPISVAVIPAVAIPERPIATVPVVAPKVRVVAPSIADDFTAPVRFIVVAVIFAVVAPARPK